MTIEEKLRKTLQTKTGLKEVINAKGGTITDETPFEEYITQVENLSGGGNSVTYVPVPSEGYVEKIYFNTSLSIEEVDNIISNANLEWNNEGTYSVINTSASESKYVTIAYIEGVYMMANSDDMLFCSQDLFGIGFEGWNPSIINPYEVNDTASSTNNRYDDNGDLIATDSVGVQNEALKELVYVKKQETGELPMSVDNADIMNRLLTDENIGKIYKYVGETDDTYTNGAYYIVEGVE